MKKGGEEKGHLVGTSPKAHGCPAAPDAFSSQGLSVPFCASGRHPRYGVIVRAPSFTDSAFPGSPSTGARVSALWKQVLLAQRRLVSPARSPAVFPCPKLRGLPSVHAPHHLLLERTVLCSRTDPASIPRDLVLTSVNRS